MAIEQLKNLSEKKYRISGLEKAAGALLRMSLTERLIFFLLSIVFAASAFSLVVDLNEALTIPIPASGGTATEGIIGIPRFINPLLAISDADRDLTALIYSGLMRVGNDGLLIPDLAESYSLSENGLEYTFKLREGITFQDDFPITADDVIFTIKKAQDQNLKSPRRANWDGVSVEKTDARTVVVKLKQPYPPFLENTTLGILPEHIWKNVDAEQFTFSQYNIEPIGSGPYKIKSIKRSGGGIPLSYTLVPFEDFALGEAHLNRIILTFYKSENDLISAYERGEISNMNSISPYRALALKALGVRVESVSLPRVFAVFLNQSKVPAFTYLEIRKALSQALDRERIVSEVLSGYGIAIYNPLPPTLFGNSTSTPIHLGTVASSTEEARAMLTRNGWIPNKDDGVMEKVVKKQVVRLEFSIATANTDELKAAAKIIQEDWEKIGAKVTLNFFDTSDLNQNVIRPRSYDALFFGEIIGRDLDLFAFWHSSQRNDPGLNVALYTSITADKLLEQARTIGTYPDRIAKYQELARVIEQDVPAIFVYSPEFIYTLSKDVHWINTSIITIPSDRFINVANWYTETDRVWKIFATESVPQKAQ